MGVLSQTRAGLFREGRTEVDISCAVNEGALLTVEDVRRESGFESIASSIASPPMTSRRRPNEREAAAHRKFMAHQPGSTIIDAMNRLFRRGSTARACWETRGG